MGVDASQKLLSFFSLCLGATKLLAQPAPYGFVGGAVLRCWPVAGGLSQEQDAKKYRHGMEYGSARWGTHEDIAPYIDPVFQNNVILTKTESLTMSSRPKDPKTARNKKCAGNWWLRFR